MRKGSLRTLLRYIIKWLLNNQICKSDITHLYLLMVFLMVFLMAFNELGAFSGCFIDVSKGILNL
jgi:hypothetical protein